MNSFFNWCFGSVDEPSLARLATAPCRSICGCCKGESDRESSTLSRFSFQDSGRTPKISYMPIYTPVEGPQYINREPTPMIELPNQLAPAKFSDGKFEDSYDLLHVVGTGSTSLCHLCRKKGTKEEFAVKVIDKKMVQTKFAGLLAQFQVEIEVLQYLTHPNVIHLEDVFETSNRLYMITELMKGGELFDYIVEKSTLSEEEASYFVRQITAAVAHMHARGIIHRDLKPENLLLTSKSPSASVKIIDFGLAKMIRDQETKSFLGTRGYLAPELLRRETYSKSVDMWALGIIVYVLLCGCLPFDDDGSRIASVEAAKAKFGLRFPTWASDLSESAKDLLRHLLDVDVTKRFTAEQAMNHPWVRGRTVPNNNFLSSPRHMTSVWTPRQGRKSGFVDNRESSGAKAGTAAEVQARRKARQETNNGNNKSDVRRGSR